MGHHVMPVDPDGPGCGSGEAQALTQQRRLPGAVRAEDPQHLAGPDLQRDPVVRDDPTPIELPNLVDFE
jgi:hypothetical protein